MMIHALYDDILYDEISIMPSCGLLVYIFIMIILNCLGIISQNNIQCMSCLDNATMWHIDIKYMIILYDDFI